MADRTPNQNHKQVSRQNRLANSSLNEAMDIFAQREHSGIISTKKDNSVYEQDNRQENHD